MQHLKIKIVQDVDNKKVRIFCSRGLPVNCNESPDIVGNLQFPKFQFGKNKVPSLLVNYSFPECQANPAQ